MKIECWKCGACCRKAHLVPEMKEHLDENGQCKYFINNECSIYYTRPDVCNCEKMYELKYKDTMTKEQYIQVVKTVCIILDNEYNKGK